MRRAVAGLVMLVATLVAARADATTARVLELAEHVARSEAVVEGWVVARRLVEDEGQQFAESTIAVDEVLAGQAGSQVVVRQLGDRRVVVGDGRLAVGDRVVVFVRRIEGRHFLTALAQSVFHVEGSGDQAPAVRDLSELSLVRPDTEGHLVPVHPPTHTTIGALRRAIREAR